MVSCVVWLSQDPGVGKTYGIEQVIEKDSIFDVMADRPMRHTFVKGTMSPCRSVCYTLQVQ